MMLMAAACTTARGATEDPTTTAATPTTTAATTTTRAPTTTTEPPDTTPPVIQTDPANGSVSTEYITEVAISTEPGATVMVDGEPLTVDGGAGVVSRRSALGENAFRIEATDAAGNTASAVYTYEFEPEPGWVSAFGDSVMLGTADEIEKRLGDGVVDATVSRQFSQGVALAAREAARQRPPSVIIIGLGTNGPVSDDLFDRMMEGLGDVPLVVFVNTRVPRAWEAGTNAALASGVERYDNTVLVDWWAAADSQPQLFRQDGFHPLQAGRVLLADLIADAVFPDAGLDLLTAKSEPEPAGSDVALDG
jgi:lysophospholipase L1-like esterase